jgi:hypothetical protein
MDSKIVEIGPGQNLLPTIKEADQANSLFVGGHCKLIQWSVSRGEVIKDYCDIMANYIWSMVQTSSKNYLFVSDVSGQ